MAANSLNDVRFIAGMEGYKCIVGPAKAKNEYKDGNATGNKEAVRVALISQQLGTINLDLVPYSDEKLQAAMALFATSITTDNLVNVKGFKTSVMNSTFYITVTAEDISMEDFD